MGSEEGTFQIDFNKFEKALSPKTKVVIINSPNNPSGVVYTEKSIKKLAEILKKHSEKYGAVYLLADEPYRELTFDKSVTVPYVMN